ncbi:hypothetical protein L914_19641 [Phytophthora nicotianae]|uniref:Uncharacterized protein n=1 Tax=Phytophthora nicotianae TaxID=4792 RepID=W2M9S3_PHYNI|nr:hypothetical protein L914_19641 [Phytophthora nicotianae]
MDASDLSLLDAFTQAATDVLGSIPAQRCIVYIYDKAANLLRPQVVVDCHDKEETLALDDKPTATGSEPLNASIEQPGEASKSSAVGFRKENVATSPLVSIPPVMGMVSSCFLQRRCLRMEESNPHRAFHRDYDVPKDMHVESILCAPVILSHRVAAVIQLLNRLDTTERSSTPQDIKDELSTEVRLQRFKSANGMVETGFSIKDEQKLMHFTIHIAQTIEINTKRVASVRNHAKIREDKAKQAMDLLNALNGTGIAHADNTETEMLLPTEVDEFTDHSTYMRRTTITRLPTQAGAIKDMLGVLVVVMRLQAMFRGRRQRRAEKFAEELEKFRRQRERMKTMIAMRRIVRTPEEPKPRVHVNERLSISHPKEIRHPKDDSPHSNPRVDSVESRLEEQEKLSQSHPTRSPRQSVSYSVSTPASPRPPPQQPVTPPRRVSTPQTTHILRRKSSATIIQKVFRHHQQRRRAITRATIVKQVEASEKVASAVKVQSFIRGNLVRKRIRKALLARQGPHIVCLRVASCSSEVVSNQNNHESSRSTTLRPQTCIYPMPERPGKTPPTPRRTLTSSQNQEEILDEYQSQKKTQSVAVESRRLLAIHKGDGASRLQKPPTRQSKPRWGRLIPSVVWATSPHPTPPGVEFVKHAKRPEMQNDTVNSPRATSMAIISKGQKGSGKSTKPSVRLPLLGPQLQQREAGTSSLLCCLLPAQQTGGFVPTSTSSLK